jgi:beta-glucosidase
VAFDLDARSLSMVDTQGQRAVNGGQYQVFVGGAQPGDTEAGQEQPLTITGTQKISEQPAPPVIRIVRK